MKLFPSYINVYLKSNNIENGIVHRGEIGFEAVIYRLPIKNGVT